MLDGVVINNLLILVKYAVRNVNIISKKNNTSTVRSRTFFYY